jgi:hypothetical protein
LVGADFFAAAFAGADFFAAALAGAPFLAAAFAGAAFFAADLAVDELPALAGFRPDEAFADDRASRWVALVDDDAVFLATGVPFTGAASTGGRGGSTVRAGGGGAGDDGGGGAAGCVGALD